MVVSRQERRANRKWRVGRRFSAAEVEPALDLLELLELAWHDCYGEVTPSEEVVDDILLLSQGKLTRLIQAVRLAVTDWRDLKMAAAAMTDDR